MLHFIYVLYRCSSFLFHLVLLVRRSFIECILYLNALDWTFKFSMYKQADLV